MKCQNVSLTVPRTMQPSYTRDSDGADREDHPEEDTESTSGKRWPVLLTSLKSKRDCLRSHLSQLHTNIAGFKWQRFLKKTNALPSSKQQSGGKEGSVVGYLPSDRLLVSEQPGDREDTVPGCLPADRLPVTVQPGGREDCVAGCFPADRLPVSVAGDPCSGCQVEVCSSRSENDYLDGVRCKVCVSARRWKRRDDDVGDDGEGAEQGGVGDACWRRGDDGVHSCMVRGGRGQARGPAMTVPGEGSTDNVQGEHGAGQSCVSQNCGHSGHRDHLVHYYSGNSRCHADSTQGNEQEQRLSRNNHEILRVCEAEDELPLGSEAYSIVRGEDHSADGRFQQQPVDKRLLWVRPTGGGSLGKGHWQHSGWTSFNSDVSNLTSGSATSVNSFERLLQTRQADPEQVLINLGFAGSSEHVDNMLSRIPQRFLQSKEADGRPDDDDDDDRDSPRVGSALSQTQVISNALASLRALSTLHQASFFPTLAQSSISAVSDAPPSMAPPSMAPPSQVRSVLHPDNQRFLAMQGFYGDWRSEGGERSVLVSQLMEGRAQEGADVVEKEEEAGNQKNATDRRRLFHTARSKLHLSLPESSEDNEDAALCREFRSKSMQYSRKYGKQYFRQYSSATESTDSGDISLLTTPTSPSQKAVGSRRGSFPPTCDGGVPSVKVDSVTSVDDLYSLHNDDSPPHHLGQQRKRLTETLMSDLDNDDQCDVSTDSCAVDNTSSLSEPRVIFQDIDSRGKSADDSHITRTDGSGFDSVMRNVSLTVCEKDRKQNVCSPPKWRRCMRPFDSGSPVKGGGLGFLINVSGTRDGLSDSGSDQTVVTGQSSSSGCGIVTGKSSRSECGIGTGQSSYSGCGIVTGQSSSSGCGIVTGQPSSSGCGRSTVTGKWSRSCHGSPRPTATDNAMSAFVPGNLRLCSDSESPTKHSASSEIITREIRNLGGFSKRTSYTETENPEGEYENPTSFVAVDNRKRGKDCESSGLQTSSKIVNLCVDLERPRSHVSFDNENPITCSENMSISTDTEMHESYAGSADTSRPAFSECFPVQISSQIRMPKSVLQSNANHGADSKPVKRFAENVDDFSCATNLPLKDTQCSNTSRSSDNSDRSLRLTDRVLHVYHSLPKRQKSSRDEHDRIAPDMKCDKVQTDHERIQSLQELPRMSDIQSDSGFDDAEIGGVCSHHDTNPHKVGQHQGVWRVLPGNTVFSHLPSDGRYVSLCYMPDLNSHTATSTERHEDTNTSWSTVFDGEPWKGSSVSSTATGEPWKGSSVSSTATGESWKGNSVSTTATGEPWKGNSVSTIATGEPWKGSSVSILATGEPWKGNSVSTTATGEPWKGNSVSITASGVPWKKDSSVYTLATGEPRKKGSTVSTMAIDKPWKGSAVCSKTEICVVLDVTGRPKQMAEDSNTAETTTIIPTYPAGLVNANITPGYPAREVTVTSSPIYPAGQVTVTSTSGYLTGQVTLTSTPIYPAGQVPETNTPGYPAGEMTMTSTSRYHAEAVTMTGTPGYPSGEVIVTSTSTCPAEEVIMTSKPGLAIQRPTTVDRSRYVDTSRSSGCGLDLDDQHVTYGAWRRELLPRSLSSDSGQGASGVRVMVKGDSVEASSVYSATSATDSLASSTNWPLLDCHKLVKLINQPATTFKGRRTRTTFYKPKWHLREWPYLRNQKRLEEETRLAQYAMHKFKRELGMMETSFMARYHHMSYDDLTRAEREDVEEMQHLWEEVRHQATNTEQLLTSRMKTVAAGNQHLTSLTAIAVLQRMTEVLKEQQFQKQLAGMEEEREEDERDWEWGMERPRRHRYHHHRKQFHHPACPTGSWSNLMRAPTLTGRYSCSVSHLPTTSHQQLCCSLISEVRLEMRSSLETIHKDLLERDKEIRRLQLEMMLKRRPKKVGSAPSLSRRSASSAPARNSGSKETEV